MALENYTEEQLDTLYRLWGMKRDASTSKSMQLYRLDARMEDSIAARFVWERLTPDERNVLYRAVTPNSGTSSGITQEELRKKAQLPEERFEAALSQLTTYRLLRVSAENRRTVYGTGNISPASKSSIVWTNGYSLSDTLYSTGRELFMPGRERTNKELSELLTQLSDDELYKLIPLYHIDITGYYSQADLRYGIASGIKDAGNLLDQLPYLDESVRSLMLWLRDTGRKATMQAVREKTRIDDAQLIDVLHQLASSALAFDTFSDGVHILFIPQDIYVGVSEKEQKGAGKKPKKAALIQVEQEPAMVRNAEPIAVYDIATIVGAVYQQRIEPNQTGKLPKRIATKLRPMLRGQVRKDYTGEDEYLDILMSIMVELGILALTEQKTVHEKPAFIPGSDMMAWADDTLAIQTSVIANYWLHSNIWRDIYGVHYKAVYAYTWNPYGGHNALLQHLAACEPNRWYTVESLLDLLWEKDAFAFRPQKAFPARAKVNEIRALWDVCEAEVYTGLLASTLNEFGMVSVGFSQSDVSPEQPVNPDMFLVTDLGAQLLEFARTQSLQDFTETVSEEPERSLVVQPNFELLLLQPDIPTLYSLLPFAQIKQLGLVSTLKMTKASVLRGLMSGSTEAQFIEMLRERSQKELAQNVEYTLHDWMKDYRDVNISQVLLFEVSHEDVIARLKSQPLLKDAIVRQLTPTMLAVKNTVNTQALRKALEKEGIVVNVRGDIYTLMESPYRDYFNFGTY